MISDQKTVISELKAVLTIYDGDCKNTSPGQLGKKRKSELGELINKFEEKSPYSDLTHIIEFYLKEKGSESRLIEHLTNALFKIFSIPTPELSKKISGGPLLARQMLQFDQQKTKERLLHQKLEEHLNEKTYQFRIAT